MSLKNIAKLVKQATRTDSTPADKFLGYLERAIQAKSRQEDRKPSATFKPSSIGGCMRIPYFQLTEAPIDDETPTPELVGILESGTDRHQRIQEAVIFMQEVGIECKWVDVEEYLTLYPQEGTELVERKGNEYKLYNSKYNMSFMCDGIIKMDGTYFILEIKTETSFKFNDRKDIDPKHDNQYLAYSLALGIDDVIFVYENRDVCKKRAFHRKITKEEIQEKVVSYMDTVNKHIDEGTVPPRTENPKDCMYCRYVEECNRR